MISVDNPIYQETLDLLRGQKQLSPLYTELKAWLLNEFQITSYNFEFRKMNWAHAPGRFRLMLLLSSRADYDSMFEGYNYSADKQAAISQKLYELAIKYQVPDLDRYQDVFIAYCDFSEEIRADCNSMAYTRLKERLKEKYRFHAVWDIFALFSFLTVFYQKDADVHLNQENGISRQIKNEYYETLHALDEFRVFTYESFNITFDSKENLDDHYQGNLYFYFK